MISDSPCIATILDLKLLLSTYKILEEYWQWPKINRVHLGIYLEEYFRLCIATNVIKTALTFSDGGYTRYGALERPVCSGMPAQVDQSVYSNRPVQFFKLAMIDLSDRPPKLTQKTWWIEAGSDILIFKIFSDWIEKYGTHLTNCESSMIYEICIHNSRITKNIIEVRINNKYRIASNFLIISITIVIEN